MILPDPSVRTQEQLLADFAGPQPEQLRMRDLIATMFNSSDIDDANSLNGNPGPFYLDRANHTGLQSIATIDGLTEALDAKLDEAPNDGNYYARRNNAWAALAAIAVSGSASDLTTGTVPNARISGTYTGFTALTMTSPLTMTGHVLASTATLFTLLAATADAADNARTAISGGGAIGATRGGYVDLYGNEHATFPGSFDIEAGVTAVNAFLFGGGGAGASLKIRNQTVDGSDSGEVVIAAGGGLTDAARGAYLNLYGNEHATLSGRFTLNAGATSTIAIIRGGSASGAQVQICTATADGSDNGSVHIAAGGAITDFGRGAYISLYGNEHANTGILELNAGNNASGHVRTTQGGFVVGAPTGGNKGTGNINAVGVYDDNTLLTCMALQPEFLERGEVDLEKWDSMLPNRGKHTTAHLFAKLVAEGVDPREPAAYVQALRANAALPGMPSQRGWAHNGLSTGEMVSRLWLAVEMLAVAWMYDRRTA